MRIWHSLAVGLGLLLPAACGDSATSVDLPPLAVRLQQVFGSAAGLVGPIDLQAPPGDSRLFIAERTAEGHVERIRNKLGMRSRTEVATWAVAHGLGPRQP